MIRINKTRKFVAMPRMVGFLAAILVLGFHSSAIAWDGPESAEGRTLLAIFAHPDDEITAAPALAKFAREGATVQLAIVTDGQHGGSPGGEELKIIREAEALCSTQEMGIDPPIFLEFEDGEVAENVNQVNAAIAALLAEVQPDVVVTWGPEGGYGHKDHRVVGAIVAGLFQAGVEGAPDAVFYPGIPHAQLDAFVPTSGFGFAIKAVWGRTDIEYLQYKIDVSDEDVEATYAAAACHESQWSPATLFDINALVDAGENTVYMRKSHKKGRTRRTLFHHHSGYFDGREWGEQD